MVLGALAGSILIGSTVLPAADLSIGDALPDWPTDFVARLEALALLQEFNADLLSHDSATATLERWCGLHHLAAVPRILAERSAGAPRAPTTEQRRELGVTAEEPVRYRHVRLQCGTRVLSEADNWYVPSRLTPAMNEALERTDTPFGKVVQALHFQRHTLSSQLLWHPLPEGWELQPASALTAGGAAAREPLPAAVLEHRAVLLRPDGTPFSEVDEVYSGNLLAFPAPALSTAR
jgi:chorismate-pyruvate lyase